MDSIQQRNTIKKRSLWGYDSNEVESKIRLMQEVNEHTLQQLEAKLNAFREESERLQAEIEKFKQPQEEGITQQISHLLLETHLKNTELLQQKQQELKAMEEEQKERLLKKQQELEMVKQRLHDALQYLQSFWDREVIRDEEKNANLS